jgi:hypothetical protein
MTDYSDPMNTYPPPFPEFVKDEQAQNPIVKFLQFILDGAENVDLNHRDFRIQVAQMAQIEMDKIAADTRPDREGQP